jgi:hypothetical protein
VLMTPYYIEPNRADPMRAMMDRYGEVVRQLAGNTKPSWSILKRRSSVSWRTFIPWRWRPTGCIRT